MTPEHLFTTLTSKRRKRRMTLTPTVITADQIEAGDTICTQGRYGEYRMTVSYVQVKDGLVTAEGTGRFVHASASHETHRLYSFGSDERVTVRR